ncbi:hypothetical protein UFOVP74_51 [uncultured Caudovirales phage]|uniref:Uncharacterized protein n=1 Tax=uncultured Caudovirales phage TaxID=2100421 RepID=A0A6J5KZL5_9CAUD|nr:hypothetical protein UFOVP74_51 [uncultured Caudovirales phage]
MNELNNAQLPGMFAAYSGNVAQYTIESYTHKGKVFGANEGYVYWHNGIENTVVPYDYKPIMQLTPLSAITDEDALLIARLAVGEGANVEYRFTINDVKKYGFESTMHEDIKVIGVEYYCKHPEVLKWEPIYLVQIDTAEFDVINGFYSADDGYEDGVPENMVEIIDFLRSKGYDCGYLHITSLIAAGYAVDKTKQI